MFSTDPLLKNAHDLTLATMMVRDAQAYEAPKPQADRSEAIRRLVLALTAAAPLVVWLAWAVLS